VSSDESNPYARPTAYPLDPGRARIGMSAGPLQTGLRRPAGSGILSGSPLPMGPLGAPWGVAPKRGAEPAPAPPPEPVVEAAPPEPEAAPPVWTMAPLEVVPASALKARRRRADWVPAAAAFAVAGVGVAILVAVARRPAPTPPSALPAFAPQTAFAPPPPVEAPPAALRGPAETPSPMPATPASHHVTPKPTTPSRLALATTQPRLAPPAPLAVPPVPAPLQPKPASAAPSDPNAPIATHTPG
jgi:hypothetical protein